MANTFMGNFGSRLQHAWNAFAMNKDPTVRFNGMSSTGYGVRPDRPRFTRGNGKTITNSIYNRIALDVASIDIRHVKLDENGRYIETIESSLNNCFDIEANIDQSGRAFVQDIVMTMMDAGVVAIVPVDTIGNPFIGGSYEIKTLRVGRIVEWFPREVKVRLYNDRTGQKEEIQLPKHMVGIIENPLYSVVNEPNSTMSRLVRKIALMDSVDELTSSGKLDLIIQLPYAVKTEYRRQQANNRLDDIKQQLKDSEFGIAYTDGTEKITQLNRPIENNLLKQVEYLTNMLYSQLGITQTILDGTADEKTMLNYYNRTVEPIVAAIVDEMKRKFLTKTARSQKQSIMYFRDPFKLAPINDIAEIADKFTRNEIMSKNEIRQIVGMKPSDDPKADQLINSNISQPDGAYEERIDSSGDQTMMEEEES